MEYSEVQYLRSKRSVDDRALNRVVLSAFEAALQARASQGRLCLLELGAGVGTMLQRLAEWGVLSTADYTLVDRDLPSLEAARAGLCAWADRSREEGSSWLLTKGESELRVSFVHGDALEFTSDRQQSGRFDAVLANAVLDLMELSVALPKIFAAVKPDGVYWFTINFDGETCLLPHHDLDEAIMGIYHRTMDERVIDGAPAGDSLTGRHLLLELPKSGASIESAGSSDWVVVPSGGDYPAEEGYFLHHIVHYIEGSVGACLPDATHPALTTDAFAAWVAHRKAQIERSELVYMAHQLDMFGRCHASG